MDQTAESKREADKARRVNLRLESSISLAALKIVFTQCQWDNVPMILPQYSEFIQLNLRYVLEHLHCLL